MIIHPFIINISSNSGIAVISLLFSSVCNCPNTNLLVSIHAFTICIAFLSFSLSYDLLTVFPSIAIIGLSLLSAISFVQFMKQCEKLDTSRFSNTLWIVSCEGIPFGSSKYFLNHFSFISAKKAISS